MKVYCLQDVKISLERINEIQAQFKTSVESHS